MWSSVMPTKEYMPTGLSWLGPQSCSIQHSRANFRCVELAFTNSDICIDTAQVAGQAEFEIKGFPLEVVDVMIRFIYGFPYHEQITALKPTPNQLTNFWIDILLIANEYGVQSLTTATTESVLSYLGKGTCPTAESIQLLPQQYKDSFAYTVFKVSELYHNNELADTSCLDGIIWILCQHGFWIYEENMQVARALESLEPVCARILYVMNEQRKLLECCCDRLMTNEPQQHTAERQ